MWEEPRLMTVKARGGECVVGNLASGEQFQQRGSALDGEVVIGIGSIRQVDNDDAIIVIRPNGQVGWLYRHEVSEV